MKTLLYVFVIGALIFSCSKDSFDAGTTGEGSAYLNDSLFNGRVAIYTKKTFCNISDTCIDIEIFYLNSEGFLRNDMFLFAVPLKIGKFEISYNPIGSNLKEHYQIAYTKYYQDGDVAGPIYMVSAPDPDNWIEIKKINLKTGYIEGGFQAKVVDRGPGNPPVRDTIYITDGKFYGNINWVQ